MQANLIVEDEVNEVKQEVKAYVAGLPMTVANQAESQAAGMRITEVRGEIKRREKWFTENILCHSKQAYNEAKKTFDAHKAVLVELVKPMKEWVETTDKNNLDWVRKERARVAAAQAKEIAKYEANRAKAEMKGKDPDAVKPPMLHAEPVKTTKSESGSYTVVERKVLNVFDETLVPEHYWQRVRNDKMIEAALRAGQEVPGARLDVAFGSAARV